MADDKPLKSTFDLAMERLRRVAGDTDAALTEEQKAAIAEIRSFYHAKLAEQEVLHQSRVRKAMDPAERETLEGEFRRDRERLASERDSKIEKIRRPK